jgi:RNA polymerase sigma-70 factor (ECF subfamily)
MAASAPESSNSRLPDSSDSPGSTSGVDVAGRTDAVLRELWPVMRVYAITLTNGNVHAVDEIMQESALYVWENRNALPESAKLRAWVSRIVYFKALSHFRDKARTPFVGFSEEIMERLAEAMPEALDKMEIRLNALTDCMGKLRKEDALLLNLHYREKLSFKKIAEHSGKNENALWQQFFRLRRALRNCVRKKISETRHEEF